MVAQGCRAAQASGAECGCGAVALFVVGAVAGVEIEAPRLGGVVAADEIDHAADGVRAVERRCSSLYNLDAPDVVEVEAVVVDVVEGLSGEAFAVDEKED